MVVLTIVFDEPKMAEEFVSVMILFLPVVIVSMDVDTILDKPITALLVASVKEFDLPHIIFCSERKVVCVLPNNALYCPVVSVWEIPESIEPDESV